jgi:O-antigen/teichoic acid export membrane protein
MIAHEEDPEKLKKLVMNTSKTLFYLIIPIIVLFVICTESIMTLWLGGDEIQLLTLSTIVLVGFSLLLSTTVTPVCLFLRLKNHPGKEIYLQAINVTVNLLVIVLFLKHLGFYAVVLGNVLSLLVSFLMCIYYQKKYLHFYPFTGMKDLLKYFFSFILIGFSTYLFALFFRETSWINIITVSIFSCTISICVFYFMKIVRNEDISFIIGAIRGSR